MSTPSPFELLTLGPFRRDQLVTTMTTTGRSPNPEIDGLIASTWSEQETLAKRDGKMLFPGALARLNGWRVDAGVLHLELGPTDFRDFLGTNVLHPELRLQASDDALSNALGVQTVLRTSDHQLILQRRSQALMEYPGLLHVCAGSMDPADGHPFVTIERELAEEHGIDPTEIVAMTCLGLSRDSRTRKPEVCLVTEVVTHSDDLRSRQSAEIAGVVVIRDDQSELAAFLEAHWHDCAPGGLASLVAYSATQFMMDIARSWE